MNDDLKKYSKIVMEAGRRVAPKQVNQKPVQMSPNDIADELESIKESILSLIKDAGMCLREMEAMPDFRREAQSAKAYWWAHLRCSLDNEHDYLSRNETMQDTIDALRDEDRGY